MKRKRFTEEQIIGVLKESADSASHALAGSLAWLGRLSITDHYRETMGLRSNA